MSRLILTGQVSNPSAPASGKVAIFADNNTLPQMKFIGPNSVVPKLLDDKLVMNNFSTANQTGFAADTYLTGSSITIPAGRLSAAGFRYKLRFDMVKTAAGTAAAALAIRVGTLGTTGDTARLTFTFGAGTAAVDTGIFEVEAHYRNVGGSAVLVGYATCRHHLAATGLISTGASGIGILPVTSGAFDSTVASLIIGASFNGGAAFSGTNTLVQAEGLNLNL